MTLAKILTAPALDDKLRSHLRLVEVRDAEFICDLRADSTLNRHLSKTSTKVEDQREWIENYKIREADGKEFYFVIVADALPRGVVRMYDFRESPRSFCWGSWILKQPSPPGLAIYTTVLMYELGFEALGFEQSHFDVRKENEKVARFHLRCGANEVGETNTDRLFVFHSDNWPEFKRRSERQIMAHRLFRTER